MPILIQLSRGSERASSAISAVKAPPSGEIIGLETLKDEMPTDLADSLKADEEDRKTDHTPLVQVKENEVVMLTATIETNLRQGLTETEDHFSGDEASSEWEEEREKSRADERFFMAVRQRVRMWTQKAVAGLRKRRRQHGWTCPQLHGSGVFFFFPWNNLMSSRPIVRRRNSHWNVSGVDRRETGLFFEKKKSRHCLGSWSL